jgi:hypothetical protein
MWTAVRETYQRFRANHTTAPNEIEDLIATVKMPPDVGDRKGSDLILWPVEHAGSLNHDQRLLIVSLVYPPRNDRPGKITDYTFIAAHVAIDFHQARGKLAHFWSRAPRNVDTSHFVRHYQSALPDLVLLSWFDIALKQWTRDPDEGKVFVFKVAHAISAVHH